MDNDRGNFIKKNEDNKNTDSKINKQIYELEKKNLKYNVRLNDVNTQISEIRILITEKLKDFCNSDITELDNKLEELNQKKEKIILAQKDNKRKLNNLYDKQQKLSKPTVIFKNQLKTVVKTPIKIIKNVTISAASNAATVAIRSISPLDKKNNINDVSETGVESLRMTYTTAKRARNTVKTVQHSVKTTQRTIKTTGKVVKATGKITYKVASFTVKATAAVIKATTTAAVHIVAVAINPIFIIIIAFILVFLMCAAAVLMLLGGGGGTSNNTEYSISNPVGIGNIPEGWKYGIDFLNTAKDKKKGEFENIINNLYYDENDKTHSDLVYMERTSHDSSKTIYNKSFAVDSQKNTLKAAFDWNLSLTDLEILSITYIYLEKKENEKNNTIDGIYEIAFTQEIIDEIVNKLVMFNDSVYSNQECPGKVCTKHVETNPNPEFERAKSCTEKYLNAYNDWIIIADLMSENSAIRDGRGQATHWNNNIQWRIDNWNYVYDHATPYYSNNGSDFCNFLYNLYSNKWDYTYSLPQTIETVTYSCEHQHNLHSLGLAFFAKDDIMKSLDFSENEIEWEKLTESGFELAVTLEG